MAKGRSEEVKRLSTYANYLLMLTVLSALLGYFYKVSIRSIPSFLFLLFFGGFFFIVGYMATKYGVVFTLNVTPIEKQNRKGLHKTMGYLFILLGILLFYSMIRMVL